MGGQLQQVGTAASATTLTASLTEAVDRFEIDLTAAYGSGTLHGARRTFVFDRSGAGSLTVTDDIALHAPLTVGTALITLGTFERLEETLVRVTYDGAGLLVRIHTDGAPFALTDEVLVAELPEGRRARRLGIDPGRAGYDRANHDHDYTRRIKRQVSLPVNRLHDNPPTFLPGYLDLFAHRGQPSRDGPGALLSPLVPARPAGTLRAARADGAGLVRGGNQRPAHRRSDIRAGLDGIPEAGSLSGVRRRSPARRR